MIDFTWLSFANSIAFFAAIYTAGGAICRFRHSSHHMQKKWIAIYYAMFCLAIWAMLNILIAGIDLWGCAVCVSIAVYIHLTKSAWDKGVATIAQPDYVPPDLRKRRAADLENAS
jgi:hypothetical protein